MQQPVLFSKLNWLFNSSISVLFIHTQTAVDVTVDKNAVYPKVEPKVEKKELPKKVVLRQKSIPQ